MMKGGNMESKIEQARKLLSELESREGGFVEGVRFFRIQDSLIKLRNEKIKVVA